MQVNSIIICKKYIYIINANANKIYIIPGAIHIIIKNIGVVKFMAKNNVVNIKLDAETKSKLETLAYIRRMTLQELCKCGNYVGIECEEFTGNIELNIE